MTDFIDHQTGRISWRDRPGEGPVLLALHGIGSEARCFDTLAAHLPGWRVIAWNAPGYGASQPLAPDWPVAVDYAVELERLVIAIGLRQFHLLGHSLGTLIAAAYSAAYPARVQSLTLAACAQGAGIAVGAELPPVHAARIDDLAHEGATAFANMRARRLIHAPDANRELVQEVAASMAKIKLSGYTQAVRMLASGNLAADCAKLTVPTSVAVGAQDIVTPPDQSTRAHSAIPMAVQRALIQIPNVGHAIHLQAPGVLGRLLTAQVQINTNHKWSTYEQQD